MFHHYAASPTGGPSHFHDPPPQLQHARLPARAATTLDLSTTAATSKTLSGATEVAKPLVGFSPNNLQYPGPPLGSGTTSLQQLNAEYPLFHGGRNRLSSTIATPMTKTTMRVPATDAYLPVTSTTSLATTSCKATPMVYQSPAGNMSPTVSVNNRFPRANYQQEHHHHHHQYHNQHYYHPPPHTSSPTTPKHLTTSTTGTGSYLLLSNPPPVSSASRSATAPPRQTSSSSPSSRNRYLQQQQNVRHRSPDLSPAVTVAAPSSLRHAYQPFPTTTTTRTVSAASPVAKDSHAGGNRSPSASHLYHQQLPATFSPTMTANYQPQQHQYHQNVPRNNVMHPTFDSFEAPDRSHQQIRHHLQAGTAPTPQQECIAQPQTLLPTSPSDRLLMLSRQSQSPSRPSRLPCSPVPPHSAAPSPPKLLPASTTASRGPPGQQSMPARPFNLPSDNLAPTRASAERRLRTFPSPSPSSVSSSAKPQVRHQSQQARLLSGSTNTTPASGAIRQLSEGAVFSSPSTVMMPSSSRMADFTGSIRMWMPDGALQSTLPSSTTQGGQLRMKSFPANSVGRYSGSVGIKFTGKAFRTALPRPAGAMTTAIGQSPLPSGGIAGARVQPPLAGGEAADGPSAASAEGGKRTVGGPIGGGGGGASGHTTSPTTAGGRSGGIGCRTANGKNNEDADGSGGEAMWVTPRFDCAASFVDCEVSPAARGKSPSAVAGPEEVRSTSGDFRNGDETDVQQLRQSLRDGDVDDNGAGKRDLTPSPMVHAPMDGGGSESQKAEIGVAEEVVMRRPAAGAGPDDRIRQKQHHRVHRGSSGDVTTTGESTSAASAQTTVPPAAGGVVASESASAQQKVEQPVAAMEGTKAVGGGQTTSSGAAEASSSSSSSFGGHEGSEWLDGVVRQIADSYRLDAEEAEKLAALLDANFIRGPAALAQSAANKRLHSLVHPVLADGLLLLLAPPETTQAEEAEREQLRVVDGETNDRDGFASPSASRDQETTKDADVVSTAVRQPNDTTAASTSSTGSTTGRGKGTSTTSTGVALAADRKGQHEEEEEDEGGNFETFMSSLGEREDDAMDDATNEESVPFLDATAVGSFQFVDASSSPLPTAERERMMSSPHQLTGGGDDDEGRRGFAGWRRALAENLGARDTQAKARGARRFELVSNREWIIENVRGSEVLEINGAEMRHNVSVRDCADGCFVKVNNKVNQIYVDRCNKTSILFNTLLGSIELINSNKIRVQVVEKCPSITIDACNGVHIYLSEASKDTIITTAKSSEVNVAFPLDEPGPDGGVDFKDSPIPEQFKTTIEKERLVTEVAQWH